MTLSSFLCQSTEPTLILDGLYAKQPFGTILYVDLSLLATSFPK